MPFLVVLLQVNGSMLASLYWIRSEQNVIQFKIFLFPPKKSWRAVPFLFVLLQLNESMLASLYWILWEQMLSNLKSPFSPQRKARKNDTPVHRTEHERTRPVLVSSIYRFSSRTFWKEVPFIQRVIQNVS